MPVSFLTAAQRESYGRFTGPPTTDELGRYFHLDDNDRKWIAQKRGESNRLGFALQLSTVRFLGTFLDDPTDLPQAVIQRVARQLEITNLDCLQHYQDHRQRLAHVEEICTRYGYRPFANAKVGFRLTRWLYALCWTGTERPSVLFERALAWMLAHKVLLPGASLLERFVAKLRSRVEARLWRLLGKAIPLEGRSRLEDLLQVPEGGCTSWLERLRRGPVRVSGPSLVEAWPPTIGARAGHPTALNGAYSAQPSGVLGAFCHYGQG
jgi:hypothetical protein